MSPSPFSNDSSGNSSVHHAALLLPIPFPQAISNETRTIRSSPVFVFCRKNPIAVSRVQYAAFTKRDSRGQLFLRRKKVVATCKSSLVKLNTQAWNLNSLCHLGHVVRFCESICMESNMYVHLSRKKTAFETPAAVCGQLRMA